MTDTQEAFRQWAEETIKADRELITAQAEKIARLEAENKLLDGSLECAYRREKDIKGQRAMVELDNERLRTVLERTAFAMTEDGSDTLSSKEWFDILEQAKSALAQQPSTEALDDYVAKETGALQAKIDRLMLEHCPDEMTPEQLEEWGKHQVSASPELTAQVEASLPPSP